MIQWEDLIVQALRAGLEGAKRVAMRNMGRVHGEEGFLWPITSSLGYQSFIELIREFSYVLLNPGYGFKLWGKIMFFGFGIVC